MASLSRIAIVAATKEDAEKVCVAGDSGIIATQKPWSKVEFKASKNGGTVYWPNGSIAELYSGDNPQSLRGPQFHAAWCDELMKWRRGQAAWDMLRMGLRLGNDPRTVITTTPTPHRMLRDLMADKRMGRDGLPLVRITRGRTSDNAANLADDFLAELKAKYAGTRLGRQELEAEILTDRPGALWTYDRLAANRRDEHPDLTRVVVAIDPPVTSGEDADECGIICAGLGTDKHGYVLADASERGLSPKEWADKAIGLYVMNDADYIVAEANNGGEMIEQVIRNIDANIKVRLVYASRGKVTRAEPVSNLDEQGRVHHVGYFKELEDQMCLAAGTLVETSKGDVPIQCVLPGDMVMTRQGWRPVKSARETGCSSDFVVIKTTDGRALKCTPTHPIFDAEAQQFVPAANVRSGMHLVVRPSWASTANQSHGEAVGIIGCQAATTGTQGESFFTEQSGKRIETQSQTASTFTMWTVIQAITNWAISSASALQSMLQATILVGSSHLGTSGAAALRSAYGHHENNTHSTAFTAGSKARRLTSGAESSATLPASARSNPQPRSQSEAASSAAAHSSPEIRVGSTAVLSVTTLRTTPESVFNLEVEGEHEFFANGVLTHNCDFTTDFDRKTAGYSPDRVDARVWAITELMLASQAPNPRIIRL